jgi:outer membrane receptor protein involved in Fe transport
MRQLECNIAYRYVDAKTTTGGILQDRPLFSPQRILGTASYSFDENKWQLDATVIWNSGGRVPSTKAFPDSLRFADRFEAYARASAQLTRRFETIDLYLGVENITNTLQRNAVIDPFDPHSKYFDASLVWGPLEGRLVYLGLRWTIGR